MSHFVPCSVILALCILMPPVLLAQPNYPPSPICHNGLYVTLSNDQPTILEAETFNSASFDDHTPEELLKFSYSEVISDTNMVLECPLLNDVVQDVSIYVTDTAGQSDFCTTYFQVNDLCDSSLTIGDDPTDTLPPVGILRNGMESHIPPTGYLLFCARSFDVGSYDDQTAPEDIIFSFSPDTSDQCMTFTCLDAVHVPVNLYITDQSGNQTVASSFLRLSSCDTSYFDTLPPTINCLDTTLHLMEGDPPTVELESNRLIDNVSDNGTPYNDLAYSGTAQDTVFQYHCIDTHSIFDYPFRVRDLYGNTNSCMASVQIEDPESICRDSTTYAELPVPSYYEIYPNPVGQLLQIKDKGIHFSQAVVRLISMGGHVLLKKRWPDAQQRIELKTSTVPGGLYILEITTHSGQKYRDKIIIRKH